MPHIIGQDDAKQCAQQVVTGLDTFFAKSEEIDGKIHDGTYTGDKLKSAEKMMKEHQHATDKINKELDKLVKQLADLNKEEDEFLAG